MELLERETDLAHLKQHLRQAATGDGRVVFLAGEAGSGKTSLVDAFCQRIADEVAVLRTSCDALSTPGPLGPLRDLVAALGMQSDRFATDREGRDQLFRAVLDALAAGEQPAVLVAEDAHWADGASLEFLRFLARRMRQCALLLVITYRDDEIGPQHPLRLLLGDLATAPAVHRMSLLPLSEEAVRQMAVGSERDAAYLHRVTGGNPFFITEVLASTGPGVPASVEDAVLARAARLTPEARAVLDVASVIGSANDPDLLMAIAGPIIEEVDECIGRGLLRSTDHGLAFRHELAREAILAAITPPRRRLLHARVLAALRDVPEGGRDLARLAHHAEAAGDRAAVLEFAVAAAEQATALHAPREAAAQYARALRFADRLPAAERARLLEAQSAACYLSDQGPEAIAARQAALALWRGLDDPLKVGDNLRWLSRVYSYWSQELGAEAESAATAAIEVLETLPPGPELAMAYGNLAQLRRLDHDLDEALLWGNRAITLAERLGDTETLIHALVSVGAARHHAGDDRGYADLERGLYLALDHGLFDDAGRAMTALAGSAMAVMQLDRAEHWLEAGIAFAIEHDHDFRHRYLLAGRAALRARRGDLDVAEAELRRLLDQTNLSPVTRTMALTALGHLCARRGNPEAGAALDEALALAEYNGQLMRLGPVRAARAEAALLAGDVTRARQEAGVVQYLVFSRGNCWQRGELAWLLWQAGDRAIPRTDLAEPYALLIGGDHKAAAAAWRDLGCPYEEACALIPSDDPASVRIALAAFEQLGAQPAIAQALRRLRALGVRDLPAVRRGPRASTRANAAGLTRREAEVMALVAAGLRNNEIAERLYLSPKTVRHHVSVILAKLGAETRTEATRVAAQRGLLSS
jgi:ATP/maltotriose-dependent transcriptional regulator MalT